MGGEQGAAAVDLVQMLDHGPGDREAVEGRGAAADLVEDDERAARRLVEDRGGLDHLDHEGRAAARQIVGGADPAEQPVDDADPRRSPPARSEPIWARIAISAFWRRKVDLAGHVGAGDEPEPLVRARAQSLATKARLAPLQRRLDHRMAPAADLEAGAGIDLGPHPMRRRPRSSASAAATSSAASARGGVGDLARRRAMTSATRSSKSAQLERQRPVGGAGDPAFELGQLDRGEAHRARHASGGG